MAGAARAAPTASPATAAVRVLGRCRNCFALRSRCRLLTNPAVPSNRWRVRAILCARGELRKPSFAYSRLEDAEVAVELPARDLHAVLVPLLALDLDEALEHVLAEGAQHELGLGGDLDRLAQRLG